MHIKQTAQTSSRPGQSPNLAPLSHSLLSQLELNENDPNTFREVIDDLTVQNKRLKRHLRRYERLNNRQLKRSGLFELRIRNLPPEQKQELEVVLQRFASNIQPSRHGAVKQATIVERRLPMDEPNMDDKSTPSPSPNVKPLDSAYASASTTAGTAKRTPATSAQFTTRLWKRGDPTATEVSQIEAVHSQSVSGVPDRSKQKLVVKRLEDLFLPDDDKATSDGAARCTDDSRLHRRPSSPDNLRYLRHLGLASPVSSTGPQSHLEWIYLNLLVNMAQLHTLNVTPEFVRQAIRDISARLILSEDGCKVRWRGSLEHTVVSPVETGDKSIADGFPYPATPGSRPKDRPQQRPIGTSGTARPNLPPDTGGIASSQPAHASAVSVARKTSAPKLHYKPLFAHPERRPKGQSRRSSDASTDTSSASSDLGGASTTAHAFLDDSDPSNGPLVFFDKDPFFLDLSADAVDINRVAHPSYSHSTAEPLGERRPIRKAFWEFEKKQATKYPTAGSQDSLRRRRNSTAEPQSPLLETYNDQASVADDSKERSHVYLEASGIGGIQLDDNFTINVKSSSLPTSVRRPLYPGISHRLRDTTSPTTHGHRLEPCSQHIISHHIVSAATTHLPPSPLPPPSYVYPALSSSNSSSDDGYASIDDVDLESELEFRQVSLSPQMRMFLEQQEPPSPQDGFTGVGKGWGSEGINESSMEDEVSSGNEDN